MRTRQQARYLISSLISTAYELRIRFALRAAKTPTAQNVKIQTGPSPENLATAAPIAINVKNLVRSSGNVAMPGRSTVL